MTVIVNICQSWSHIRHYVWLIRLLHATIVAVFKVREDESTQPRMLVHVPLFKNRCDLRHCVDDEMVARIFVTAWRCLLDSASLCMLSVTCIVTMVRNKRPSWWPDCGRWCPHDVCPPSHSVSLSRTNVHTLASSLFQSHTRPHTHIYQLTTHPKLYQFTSHTIF